MQVLETWYQVSHKTLILVGISEYYFSYCYIFTPQLWVFYYGPPQSLHDSKYQLNTANTVKEKHIPPPNLVPYQGILFCPVMY